MLINRNRFSEKFNIASIILIASFGLILSGCNASPKQPMDTGVEATETSEAKKIYAPLDGQTVFSVLAAEMALAQQNYELALSFYLALADHKRDASAAKRVVAISQVISSWETMIEGADIWIEATPEDPTAYLAKAQALVKSGRHEDLEQPIGMILSLNAEYPLENILVGNQDVSDEDAEALSEILDQLIVQFPQNAGLYLAKANVSLKLKDLTSAQLAIKDNLSLRPTPQSYLLAARIHESAGDLDLAATQLKKGLKAFQVNRQLTAQYTRLLGKTDQPEKALDALENYYRVNPDDAPMTSMYARVALEVEAFSTARRLYDALLESHQTKNEASYFLGHIAKEEDRIEAAIEYFKLVGPSNFLAASLANLSALVEQESGTDMAISELESAVKRYPEEPEGYRQLARLYYSQDKFDQSVSILDEGLKQNPENNDLLYARALALDIADRPEEAVVDLRKVLENDPENAMALNALGYTLADNKMDLDEAWALIKRAYEMTPDDPAVIDSMGWIHYRRGELSEAATLLTKAFDQTKNHEIAAHLGEVLWQMDRKSEAESIWQQGLEDKPDSAIILETQERLMNQ